jgi:hypothetical protein
MVNRSSNDLIKDVRNQTSRMRDEIASELGILDKLQNDSGNLTTREAGRLGGNIVRSMVRFAETAMQQQNAAIPIDIDPDTLNEAQYSQETATFNAGQPKTR